MKSNIFKSLFISLVLLSSSNVWGAINDYRLVYIESTILGDENNTNVTRASHTLTHQDSDEKRDTVSFFINKTTGTNPAILLQQCAAVDGSSITWNTIEVQPINANKGGNPNGAMAPAKKVVDLYIGNGCPAVENDGVYNFVVQQNDGNATILNEETHRYNGDYYIRTACANGGWENYTKNILTNSPTSLDNGNYDYYYCNLVAGGTNVRYAIANRYSQYISDILEGDAVIEDNTLPADANVRFTWNSQTNELKRAYIADADNASFLVVAANPTELKDLQGNPITEATLFTPMADWKYTVDAIANKSSKVKIVSTYNEKSIYLKGNEQEGADFIQHANAYKIRLIYDFKTNILTTALLGGQEINEEISMNEVMIVRNHHDPAQALNVTEGYSVNDIEKVYGAMEFSESTLNDTKISELERSLYWVSFPFDVKLSEVFGLGNYGEHWIMEYYDGAERAEKGGWVDATYWKYWTNPTDITLDAGKGYVLAINLPEIIKLYKNSNDNNEKLYLYFPSATEISSITSTGYTLDKVEVPAHKCTINRDTKDGDRRIKDSNWNLIGVPSYANANAFNTTSTDVKFYYQWNPENNSYTPQGSGTFNTMHAYMVQFAGIIDWSQKSFAAPQSMAARKAPSTKDEYTLRLVLQQEDAQCDHTFIRLQEEGATTEFDMNVDLSKIMNSGTNIYSFAGKEEAAANVLPIEETIIPLGVQTSKAGEYTFTMPDGTDGITAILIDYVEDTETNLLFADYTTILSKGSHEGRFALHVRPSHVATQVENTNINGNGQGSKYIINGALYLLRNGQMYDAQGKLVKEL